MRLAHSIKGAAAIVLALVATVVQAQAAWDGLDELAAVARESGVELVDRERVDLGQVSAVDALFIVGPREGLPVTALTSFLREGGRIALLDDVGTGDRLLAAYQVSRMDAPHAAPALRGDPNLLVAYPASEHPLAEGVSVLLTNRAATLAHPELKPVFTFGRSGRALVLAGAVGSGRLVAIGDASLVINQLMSVPSHRRFAKNLLGYLARPGGRVWLVGPHTQIEGAYGSTRAGLARIDAWFKRLAHPDLPPLVLSLIALALAGAGLLIATSTLPRRSPYIRPDLFPNAKVLAGYAGRVTEGAREPLNLAGALIDYKREFEGELGVLFGLEGTFDAPRALAAVRARGAGEALVDELDALLAYLERMTEEHEGQGRSAQVGVSELRNVVRKGEELLGRLGNEQA